MRIDRPAPVAIQGDSGWLTQVVLALIQNAVQHTPRGGSVTVSLSAEGGNAVLSVADTGMGIELEYFPDFRSLLQSQLRAHPSGRWSRARTGHLRLDCAGAWWDYFALKVSSGHGATFTVVLPLDRKVAPPKGQVAFTSG